MRQVLLFALVLPLIGCVPTEKDKPSEQGCRSCCQSANETITPSDDDCCSGDSCCSSKKTEPVSTSATITTSAKPTTKVELTVVKYDDLIKAVRDLRGKVVVVDVWATNCGPCKKEFPHLVELHKKYADKGLVCISVSVDPTKNQANALKFLTEKNATFPNYLLDEEWGYWSEKWVVKGIPAVFVFNKAGKRAAKLTNANPDAQFTYEKDVEPLVTKLLQER